MADYNENQINSNETERIIAEKQRINNEDKRQTNETEREASEATRQTNETEREARETIRQSNETTRISEYNIFMAEVNNNEDERITNEESRVQAENSRVEAENIRAEFYEGFNDRLNVVDSQLAHIDNNIDITPDDFEGTDVEKIQQAFDFCINNSCSTVNLNRTYDITGGSILYPDDREMWKFITFKNGGIKKNDEGFMFDCLTNNKNRVAVVFKNTRFSTNTNGVYVFNGNRIIKQNVDTCFFNKVGLITSSNYIQSVRVRNCEISQLGCNFIEAQYSYDIVISNNRFESSTSNYNAIKIQHSTVSDNSYVGLRINYNVIEGYTNTCPIVIGSGYGLNISNNYFEANKRNITIENATTTLVLVAGVIECNTFNNTLGDYDIFISDNIAYGQLYVTSNVSTAPAGKYLINKYITKDYDTSNTLYAGGSLSPLPRTIPSRDFSYNVTTLANDGGGVKLEIRLNLKNDGAIYNQPCTQYLVNIKFTYGSSVWYSGHLTGILSIDGYYINGSVQCELMFNVLSSRNTSGNINGYIQNGDVYDYYFKETGNKYIAPSATSATVVITLPNVDYNTSYTRTFFKNIGSLLQQYPKDVY